MKTGAEVTFVIKGYPKRRISSVQVGTNTGYFNCLSVRKQGQDWYAEFNLNFGVNRITWIEITGSKNKRIDADLRIPRLDGATYTVDVSSFF